MENKGLTLISLISLIFVIFSCIANKPEFGISIIKKYTDTLAVQKAVVEIKNIPNNVFETASFKGKQNVGIKYRILKPLRSKKNTQKFPLVMVFHGSNAIGDDNEKQLGILAKLWALPDIRADYPAFVVAPQFPSRSSNYTMDSSRHVLVSLPQTCLQSALELIDSLKFVLNIDEKRIYALGFSMGGSAVINALSAKPDLFAAGVSISGVPQFDKIEALSTIPIWIMHGMLDTENPFKSDEQFFKEAGFKNRTRFWEFENAAHEDIFSTDILGENIPKWLFNKRKNM